MSVLLRVFQLAYPVVFLIFTYNMIGFHCSAGSFFFTVLTILLSTLCAQSCSHQALADSSRTWRSSAATASSCSCSSVNAHAKSVENDDAVIRSW
jgi:hypothetical protein